MDQKEHKHIIKYSISKLQMCVSGFNYRGKSKKWDGREWFCMWWPLTMHMIPGTCMQPSSAGWPGHKKDGCVKAQFNSAHSQKCTMKAGLESRKAATQQQ